MATCKNCLHYELCQYNAYQEAHYFGKDKEIYITIKNNSTCKFFKPTADVAEVKHGRYENDYCTICGTAIPTDDKDDFIMKKRC